MKKTLNLKIKTILALVGIIIPCLAPLSSFVRAVPASAAETEITPVAGYTFSSSNVGSEINNNYALNSKIGSPTGDGSGTSYGTVTFDGVDDLLATKGEAGNSKNPFKITGSSDISFGFDFTLKSWLSAWGFPLTIANGDDLWHLSAGHIGFSIQPGENSHLRFIDHGIQQITDGWWGVDLVQLSLDTVYQVFVTVDKDGMTNIYVNGQNKYSRPTVYNTYTKNVTYSCSLCSPAVVDKTVGEDWSVFSIGGYPWTAGTYGISPNGYGFVNCSFSNLKIYDLLASENQVSEWFSRKGLYRNTYTITYNTNGGTINTVDYPTTYQNGNQIFLPTDVSKAGSVFAGWYDNSSLTGNPVTMIKTNELGNKIYYAKWSSPQYGDGVLTPDYAYNFTDTNNPGYEDSQRAPLDKYGTVSCSNGEAVFNGSGCLYASSESKDFGELLTNFTMGFDLTLDSISDSGWQIPMTFGNNDNKYFHFTIEPNTTNLRLATYDNAPQGYPGAWWGSYIIEALSLNTTYRITVSLTVGGKLNVYLNGSLRLSLDVSSSFSMKASDLTFCIGGQYDYNYHTFQNGLLGKIGKFDVYTFAGNERECVQDGALRHIEYNTYSITLNANEGVYAFGYTVPSSYNSRVGCSLPDANNIIKEGYAFKGWYTSSDFSGSQVYKIDGSETGNKVYYAKWIDSSLNYEPSVQYDFDDSSNPGKDSKGLCNLTNKGASVSDSFLSTNGSSCLYGTGDNNFVNVLSNFTVSFDVMFLDLGGSRWVNPFSFGYNGNQMMLFNMEPGSPHVLRFKMKDGDTVIAGSNSTDALWGDELGYVPEWMWTNIVVSVRSATASITGAISIYIDGCLALNKTLPKGYSLPTSSAFSLGALYNNSSAENGVNARFDNFKVYGFYSTQTQVNYLINNGIPAYGYNLTYSVGDHGYTVGPTMALKNEEITIQTFPNDNYAVDTFTINGETITPTSTNVYKYKVSQDDNIVAVTFKKVNALLSYKIIGSGTVIFVKTGTSTEVDNVPMGTSVTVVVTPTSGYEVVSFKVNDQVETLEDGKFVIDEVSDNIHVIASFDVIKPTHSITYHENGGSWAGEHVTSYTETIGCALPGGIDITYQGFNFDGWYTTSDFKPESKITSIGEDATTDFELWAKWTPVDYKITYNSLEGGTISGTYPTGYTYGVGATLPTSVTRKGYTFNGWFDNYECEGEAITSISNTDYGDKDFFAKWSLDTYTINFNLNDGAWNSGYSKPTTYQYGDTVVLPTKDNLSKTGYTFGGWYDNNLLQGDPITSISDEDEGNKNLFAKWDVDTYNVIFNADGGTINESYEPTYTYNVEYLLPTDVTKPGYDFGGWYDNALFSGDPKTKIEAGSVDDKTFIAKWTPATFNITYKDAGDLEFSGIHEDEYPTTFVFDQTVALDVPTKAGYEFVGYYTTSNCAPGTQVFALSKENYPNDVTLYALWQVEGGSTISYHLNGGDWNSDDHPSSYNHGTAFTLPTCLDKTGYVFEGWYDNEGLTGDPVTEIPAEAAGNKTFYAKWSAISYTITYKDGETPFVPEKALTSYTYGTFYFLPTNVTKDNQVFAGWYDNPEFTGGKISYLNNDDIGNKIYYAKFEDVNNSYTIIFESNDGSGRNQSYEAIYGTNINLNNFVYSYDNYHQVSWIGSDGNVYDLIEYSNLTDIGNTIVLYASIEANTYTITFVTNGGEFSITVPSAYTFGVEITLPTSEEISKENCTFIGWYSDDQFTSSSIVKIYVGESGNKTYYARWFENQQESSTYGVSFNTNGGSIADGDFSYYSAGEAKTLPTDVFLKGNTFLGWYDNEELTGTPVTEITAADTGDKIYYAKWTETVYNITTKTDGHGVISVSKDQSAYKSNITVSATALTGYELDKIYVNGVELVANENDVYSFFVEGDSVVYATFKYITFVINIEEVEHGYIDCEESSVQYNGTIQIIIKANKGYELKTITCNGVDVTKYVIRGDYVIEEDEKTYVYDVLYYRAVDLNPEYGGYGRIQLTVDAVFVPATGCSSSISTPLYIIIPTLLGLGALIILKSKTKEDEDLIIRNK